MTEEEKAAVEEQVDAPPEQEAPAVAEDESSVEGMIKVCISNLAARPGCKAHTAAIRHLNAALAKLGE